MGWLSNMFDEMMYTHRLRRGDFDEPDIEGSFIPEHMAHLGKIWPKSDSYRIVYQCNGANSWGIEALHKGQWVTVKRYIVEYYDERLGEFNKPSRWVDFSESGGWDEDQLKMVVMALCGKTTKRIVGECSADEE